MGKEIKEITEYAFNDETGEYIRVGGQEIRKTDVRIVAATNVNMRKAVSEGKFREDLYYRLNTIPIHIPPLRERGNDIILLSHLQHYSLHELFVNIVILHIRGCATEAGMRLIDDFLQKFRTRYQEPAACS